MNSLLAREDAGVKTCFYCKKVFNNYRALGGHLRIHQEDKTLRAIKYPGPSSNSIDINRNPPASLSDSQQNSSAGGENPTPFTIAPPWFSYSTMFCSNETNHASRSKFSASIPEVVQSQIFLPPDFSNGCRSGAAHYRSSLSSRAFAPSGAYAAMPSAAVASSGSTPIDPSLHLVSNGVCEFNADEFRVSQDVLPPSSGNALENTQGYNLGCPPHSNLDKVGQYDARSLLISEEGKRPYPADKSGEADIMTALKKPKIAPNVHVENENLEKKELSLFTDDFVSASKACFGAKEEGPEDVDLSLHL